MSSLGILGKKLKHDKKVSGKSHGDPWRASWRKKFSSAFGVRNGMGNMEELGRAQRSREVESGYSTGLQFPDFLVAE